MRQAPSVLWAVYKTWDKQFVVWPLRECPDGTYAPLLTPTLPPIRPLPIDVFTKRAAACRALDLLRLDCAGTA